MKKHLGLLALVAILLLMSACSFPGTGSSLTAAQVLQNSTNAMKHLKSVHLDMKITGSIQTGLAATPTASNPTPSQTAFTLTVSGDEMLQGQQPSVKLTLIESILGQNTTFSEILLGGKAYFQNSKGQWYVLDKSVFNGSSLNPFANLNTDAGSFLSLVQNATITDHGTEALNGQNLRHISATLGKESLSQLLSKNAQLSKLFSSVNLKNLLNDIKLNQASVDVWVDEATSYVHHIDEKLNLSINLSALISSLGTPTASATPPAGLPSSITAGYDATIDFSKFDQPVTITAPANAIPTDNPINNFSPGA